MAEVGGGAVQITTKPTLAEVKARFKQRADEVKDSPLPYKRASIFLDQWVQRNFQSEGGKAGGWKKSKRAERDNGKTLQDTGRGRASYIPFVRKEGGEYNAGIGSDVPYMQAHEEGLNGLPVRRTLPKEPEVAKDIKEIFVDFYKQLFAKGIFK